MVRQLLYGSRFFQAEFGKKSEICWLPDTFGFPGSLPQILARSGVRYFYTYKLHWQNVNRFPYGMFRWRGIDGSEVLAEVPRIESGYNAKLKPSELRHAQDDNLQKGVADDLLLSYGYGDGGGGPTREMMEYGARLEGFPGMPDCRRTSALGFFKGAEKLRGNLPVWTGELYLETHRGTYTSQAMVKKMNRRCEQLLREAEIFGVIAGLRGKNVDWQAIHAAWKEVLLLQFHDILPGSSIREVYEDAKVQYDEIVMAGERSLKESLEAIAGPEDGITVFNSLSWERGDVVRMPLPPGAGEGDLGQLREAGGGPVAFVVSRTERGPEMVFTAESVPSMGLKRYSLEPSPVKGSGEGTPTSRILATQGGLSLETQGGLSLETQGGLSLETQRYAIELRTDGAISRLFDRRAGREVVPKGQIANAIHLFLDGPQQEDSWNLYPEYKAREIDPGWKNTITVSENNPVRTVVQVTRRAEKVVLTQDIVLYARLDRIDFVTSVDWRERHKIMRVSFPVEVLSPRATFEVGFGAVERPTHANTPWERAMFEVCGQRWVDLSEADYGVSLLNDSKYGYDVVDSTISLTLLRGTNYPDPGADLGAHEFTYALYPHEGDLSRALTPRRGCELNAPLRAIRSKGGAGSAKGSATGPVPGTFGVDRAHVLLDTVKPAEDGRGIMLRLYESCGSRGPVRVTTPFGIAQIAECNLMEEEEHPASAGERTFDFTIRPFEIRTFRVVPAV
jgi:alpha-mannosidase